MQNLLFPFRSRSVNRHKPVPVLLTPQSIRTSHAADTSVGTDASKEIYYSHAGTYFPSIGPLSGYCSSDTYVRHTVHSVHNNCIVLMFLYQCKLILVITSGIQRIQ